MDSGTDEPITPIKQLLLAPDDGLRKPATVPRALVATPPGAPLLASKPRRGRPPSRKRSRPPPLPQFNAAGTLTKEGWGWAKCYAAEHPELSLRDLAALFRVSVSTLHRGLQRELGSEEVPPRCSRSACSTKCDTPLIRKEDAIAADSATCTPSSTQKETTKRKRRRSVS